MAEQAIDVGRVWAHVRAHRLLLVVVVAAALLAPAARREVVQR